MDNTATAADDAYMLTQSSRPLARLHFFSCGANTPAKCPASLTKFATLNGIIE